MEFHYNVYGAFRSPQKDIELAKSAAEAGFSGIWIGEHFLPWIESRPHAHHAFTWLSTVLAEVPEVSVGTSVCCPAYRFEPPVLAQALATIEQLHPGRFNLGIGTGEAINEAHFIDEDWPSWRERADRVVECLDLIQTLWTEENYINYDGDFFSYDDIKVCTESQADIDLHWAAWGPLSSKYAGQYAGNLITPAGPNHIVETVKPQFKKGLKSGKYNTEEATMTVEMKANYGDVDELVAEVHERGEFVPAADELDNPDPRSVQQVANERLDELSDEEVADETNISDDSEYFIEKIKAYEEIGVDRIIIGSTVGDPKNTIDMFDQEVFPMFQ
ncbi:LLM class flavin-dependent oxidoreductase [Natrialba sp. INN-245]|uniref:LLM class flavin-dependent oxidoreductase n=1 Tax=Natrialba sp. INN-245 TaxID=2690967 RepID=UPI0013107266|nr:LLM class flavin-dependent oxidoreductase [Natrialba sp. INN-245]MWV40671.1 LLM class flavin-dependent oxidoreductase [Natrialba sp. INN-245]